MGGDRTCPDNCFLAAWYGMPEDQRTAQRRRPIVEKLAKQGYTQDAIAMQLGVDQRTVGRDLETLGTLPNVKGHGKDTLGRTRSTGRPKGSSNRKPETRATTPAQDKAIAKRVLDEGKSSEEARHEFGVSNTVVRRAVAAGEGRREVRNDPEIDPNTLPLSAQQKLMAAIAQHKKKLEASFADEVQRRVTARMKEALDGLLPEYQDKLRRAERILDSHTGIMSRADFRKVWACLHPDGGASEKMRAEAFNIFAKHEELLVKRTEDERKVPGPVMPWPRTYEEAMKMKAKVRQERRAKRGGRAMTRSQSANII
jgi:transposase